MIQCSPCPLGYYSTSGITCAACPEGIIPFIYFIFIFYLYQNIGASTNGKTAQAECTVCSPGYYASGSARYIFAFFILILITML